MGGRAAGGPVLPRGGLGPHRLLAAGPARRLREAGAARGGPARPGRGRAPATSRRPATSTEAARLLEPECWGGAVAVSRRSPRWGTPARGGRPARGDVVLALPCSSPGHFTRPGPRGVPGRGSRGRRPTCLSHALVVDLLVRRARALPLTDPSLVRRGRASTRRLLTREGVDPSLVHAGDVDVALLSPGGSAEVDEQHVGVGAVGDPVSVSWGASPARRPVALAAAAPTGCPPAGSSARRGGSTTTARKQRAT